MEISSGSEETRLGKRMLAKFSLKSGHANARVGAHVHTHT